MITQCSLPSDLLAAPGVGADDLELLARFEDTSLGDADFGHPQHVRVAWTLLRSLPTAVAALDRFVGGLRRFAAAKGSPGLYHETITWAYLLLIHERIARLPADTPWEGFAAASPDLLARGKAALRRYYRDEDLASELARKVFLMPLPALGEREAA